MQPASPIRVLVVEDEFLIRMTLVEALTDEGFDVAEAESGDAALPMLRSDHGIGALLTDIQLPGTLDGMKLAQRARETRPDLPVLFMTGRPNPAAEAAAAPNDAYIAKPYTLSDICDAVRRLTSPRFRVAGLSSVHTLELLLGLMTAAVLLAVAARRLSVPPAAAYTVGGLLLALTPGAPSFEIDPALILTLFLPPLLQASAFFTDWHLFRTNLRPILLLAVGCVTFTTVVVAVVTHALAPALPWAACFALGAIVSPPDAVAASAVLQRLRLPRRLVAILEGESLVNDATGLVLYRFAVAAALGAVFSPAGAVSSFVVIAGGGIAVGLACGFGIIWVARRLADVQLEIAASFLVAWASYIAAEAVGASGVLSTVACGLVLGQRQHHSFTPATRMEARATWRFVTFVLEALVFVLIGLSLRGVVARLGTAEILRLLPLAAAIVAAVTLARIAWVFPATYMPRLLPALRRRDPAPHWTVSLIVSWSGMRGMVSLAAALALPESFTGRDLVLFVTFCVIVATVLGQGMTLGPLIRALGVAEAVDGVRGLEAEVRTAMAKAELAMLEERASDPLDGAIARDVLAEARSMALLAGASHGAALAELQAQLAIKLDAASVRRTTLFALDQARHLPDSMLHGIEHEIDLDEVRLRRRLERFGP